MIRLLFLGTGFITRKWREILGILARTGYNSKVTVLVRFKKNPYGLDPPSVISIRTYRELLLLKNISLRKARWTGQDCRSLQKSRQELRTNWENSHSQTNKKSGYCHLPKADSLFASSGHSATGDIWSSSRFAGAFNLFFWHRLTKLLQQRVLQQG